MFKAETWTALKAITRDRIGAHHMLLTPGTRLGPYTIESLIGSGGMGEVYKAHDGRLNRTVAIKRMIADDVGRFQSEARAIAAINHPHICQIYDVGPDYLVLEYLQGEALGGPVPQDEAVRLAGQIADALHAAHECGILHRDLKPANVMVVRQGGTLQAKLLDFGVARLTSDDPGATRTVAGEMMGTPAYMSPEQASVKPLDARSDVFSFGAVLYELLAGTRAFTGDSTAQILSAVLRDDPDPFEAPAALQQIVRRCLAKDPDRRFQTMADVRRALQHLTGAQADATASIAVLPFANLSRDVDDEYFSDGLSEEIINALTQVRGLKVIARTSAFAFKGKNEDIRTIARTLGVTHMLEGSVRRAGGRVRVTAQLIHAADGAHRWSQRYDREMSDIFAVQDDIAAAIAGALKLQLAPPSDRRMPSLPAYEAYLRYRSYQWQFTPEASRRSRECLEQALALDPAFALPYVGLADYHFALGTVGGSPSYEAMPRARELAQHALEIDPDLPEAHAMLGIVAGHYDYDWTEAERRFRIAITREPLSPHLRQWYGTFFLFATGRADEARLQLTRVIEEDPLCQMWRLMRANLLPAVGLDHEALDDARTAVELDPGFWLGWADLGLLYARRHLHPQAMQCAERAMAGAPWCPYSVGVMAAALANQGQANEAQPLLAGLRGDAYGGPVGLAVYYVALGEIEHAVEWSARAVEQRFPAFIPRVIRPFEPWLRRSAAWSGVLKRMNLA
jgi:TolB-like protein/predicted Ser/Thr protein kinase